MARRTSTGCVVIEKPPTRASPEDGGKRVVSILIVVLLPAPFEPSNPNTSPALATSVKESTAVNEPKRRERRSSSTTGVVTAGLETVGRSAYGSHLHTIGGLRWAQAGS